MAVYALRYNWINTTTGESRDTIVYTFHVEASSAPSAELAKDDFVSAWSSTTSLNGLMQTGYVLDTVQVYDVVAGGPPVDELLCAGTDRLSPSGNPGPQEVQVCVTRWMLDGLGRPFKKGRWYFGPIAHASMNASRPSATIRNIILNFQETLHLNYIGGSGTPVIDTKGALHVGEAIVQYSIDDAWDTQRRRGFDPTSEIIRDFAE